MRAHMMHFAKFHGNPSTKNAREISVNGQTDGRAENITSPSLNTYIVGGGEIKTLINSLTMEQGCI